MSASIAPNAGDISIFVVTKKFCTLRIFRLKHDIVIPPFFVVYIFRLCSQFRLFQFHCGGYNAASGIRAIVVVGQ